MIKREKLEQYLKGLGVTEYLVSKNFDYEACEADGDIIIPKEDDMHSNISNNIYKMYTEDGLLSEGQMLSVVTTTNVDMYNRYSARLIKVKLV